MASGVRPDSVDWRMEASAFAEMPDGFSTAKCSVGRAVGLWHEPDVRLRLAVRDLVLLRIRRRGHVRRHGPELVGEADQQVGAVDRVGHQREGVEHVLKGSGQHRFCLRVLPVLPVLLLLATDY